MAVQSDNRIDTLHTWPDRHVDRRVVYGGVEAQRRTYARIVPWTQLSVAAE